MISEMTSEVLLLEGPKVSALVWDGARLAQRNAKTPMENDLPSPHFHKQDLTKHNISLVWLDRVLDQAGASCSFKTGCEGSELAKHLHGQGIFGFRENCSPRTSHPQCKSATLPEQFSSTSHQTI